MAVITKNWEGSEGERFTFEDMNRITSNANVIASSLGFRQEVFAQVTHSSQVDYREINRLETMLQEMSDLLGLGLTMETAWGPGRTISAVDFNRWEQACSAIESGMSDGKSTLRVTTGSESMMLLDWVLSDSSGVIASGSSWEGDLHFRLSSETYTFKATGFGDSLSVKAQVASNVILDISPMISVVTMSCTMPMSSVTIDDTAWEASGSEVSVGMVRSSTEHTITAQVVNDSPIYSGVAIGPLWDYKTESTFSPSFASVSAQLTPERRGVPLIVPRDGILVIPQLARFHLTAIGGGLAGERSRSTSTYLITGRGGRGGGVEMLPEVSLSDRISISIGAGQVFGGAAAGDTVVSDSSGNLLMTAKAGEGAGGGGYFAREDGEYWDGRPTSGGPYTGGGGAGYRGTYAGKGGVGGGDGGTAGSGYSDGKDGTIIDGQGYGGKSVFNGGGGGGGYGADGGDCVNRSGGGGGGVFGGRGGDSGRSTSNSGGRAGLGYGAGGGGGGQLTSSGGGGGGGLGTVKVATDGSGERILSDDVYYTNGGNGGSGAVRIVYIGD